MNDYCEMLVRMIDKVNEDPYLDAQCTKAGDVIVIMPGQHQWGRGEALEGHYGIFGVTAPVRDVMHFMSPEIETNPAEPSRVLQRRGFYLDLWTVPSRAQSVTRAGLTYDVHGPFSLEEIHSYRRQRAPLSDPNVLGE